MAMTEFWWVYRENGGIPSYKHDSLDGAKNEAIKLASNSPGTRFIVLHGIGSALLPKPGAEYEEAKKEDDIPF